MAPHLSRWAPPRASFGRIPRLAPVPGDRLTRSGSRDGWHRGGGAVFGGLLWSSSSTSPCCARRASAGRCAPPAPSAWPLAARRDAPSAVQAPGRQTGCFSLVALLPLWLAGHEVAGGSASVTACGAVGDAGSHPARVWSRIHALY